MIIERIGGRLPVAHAVVFGCGYIGGVVARALRAAGTEVVALTRNGATAAELRAAGIAVVEADLAGTDWHGQLRGRFDLVVNTVSAGGGGLDGYRRSYVAGMESVLAWAAAVEVGTLVYTSSTSVYPQGGGAVVDESASTDGTGERGALLRQSELVLTERAPAAGVGRWFVLRLAGIYGPGRHHLVDQVRAGEVTGPWTQRLNLVHRDDAAAAILACAAAPAAVGNRVYNVAGGSTESGESDGAPTKREVIAWLAERLGVPTPKEGASDERRRPATPDRIIASEAMRRELGWRPRYAAWRDGYAEILGIGEIGKSENG